MAFADRISGPVGIMWYARVSGIPYVFHNADTLPAEWLTSGSVVIDGETYAPSKTLIMRDGMSIEQTIAPKQGIASSGGQTVRFLLDSTWLDLITTALYREGSHLAHVIDGVEVDDLTLPCDDISGWPAANTVYVGTETMASASRTADDFTVVRARYGSQALPILADGDSLLSLGAYGAIAADHPTVWHGRILQLWCATGVWRSDGTFVPFGATIESAEDQRVYQGVISGLGPSRDQHRVEIKLQPLDSLLDRQVGSRLPVLRVDAAGTTMRYSPSTNQSSQVIIDGEAVKFESSIPYASLSVDGVVAAVSRAMTAKISSEAPGWYTLTDTFQITPTFDADGIVTLRFRIECTPSNAVYALFLLDAGPHSVWRILGFESNLRVVEDLLAINQVWQFEITADRPYAGFFLPASPTGVQYLWWDSESGPAYEGDTEWRTRFNGTIHAHLKVEDEIIEVGEQSVVTLYGVDYIRATIIKRGALGSAVQEHYVGHTDDDSVVVMTQGIGLPGPYVAHAWLYLMCGGSGVFGHQGFQVDRGWRGSGAYIDIGLVDVDSFGELLEDRRWVSDNLGVFSSERLRDVIQGGLIGQAYALVAGADQIRAVDITPPTISDASDAVMALDHTNTRTIGDGAAGIGLDLSERRIVNSLEISSGLDNATGEYTQVHPASHAPSIGTWGPREPLRMLLRSLSAQAVSDSFAVAIAEALLAAFGTPYAIIEVEVTDPFFWTVEPGDIVTITNEIVPTVSNGISEVVVGRGITALPARVMALRRDYPRDSASGAQTRGRATLVIANIDGTQTAHWSPTAKCTTVAFNILIVAADEYSPPGSPAGDGERFAPGSFVYLRTYDGGSVHGPYEVASSGAAEIVLTASPSSHPTVPFLIDAVPYSHASITDAQKPHAYQADADHKLDLASGSDPPRVYR